MISKSCLKYFANDSNNFSNILLNTHSVTSELTKELSRNPEKDKSIVDERTIITDKILQINNLNKQSSANCFYLNESITNNNNNSLDIKENYSSSSSNEMTCELISSSYCNQYYKYNNSSSILENSQSINNYLSKNIPDNVNSITNLDLSNLKNLSIFEKQNLNNNLFPNNNILYNKFFFHGKETHLNQMNLQGFPDKISSSLIKNVSETLDQFEESFINSNEFNFLLNDDLNLHDNLGLFHFETKIENNEFSLDEINDEIP